MAIIRIVQNIGNRIIMALDDPVKLLAPTPVTPVTFSCIVGVRAKPTIARRKTWISPEIDFFWLMSFNQLAMGL